MCDVHLLFLLQQSWKSFSNTFSIINIEVFSATELKTVNATRLKMGPRSDINVA